MTRMATAAEQPVAVGRTATVRGAVRGKSGLALFAEIIGVETFDKGSYEVEPGSFQEYSEKDLTEIARNFKVLSTGPAPLLEPSVAIGHDENDPALKDTGAPAWGWVRGLRRNTEGKIITDWSEVDDDLAQAIDSGAYRKVSAEIYDDFVDNDGKHYGKALRRVVVLGAEIPKVKGLRRIPRPRYAGLAASESQRFRSIPRVFTFAEVKAMPDAPEAVDVQKESLLAAGVSQELVDALEKADPNLLALLQRDLQTIQGAAAPPPPEPPAEMSEPASGTPGGAPKKVTVTQQFSERARRLDEQMAAAERYAAERVAQGKRARVDGDLAAAVKANELPPSYLDAGPDPDNPGFTARDLLMEADDVKVRTFSEGGKKVQGTEYDRRLRWLKGVAATQGARPRKFSDELMKQPPPGGGVSKTDRMLKIAADLAKRDGAGGKTLEERLHMLPGRGLR